MFNFFKHKKDDFVDNNSMTSPVKDPIDVEIKNILAKKNEERRKDSQATSHEELFDRMVKEAVTVIERAWKNSANCNEVSDINNIAIEAYHAFFITEKLVLGSDSIHKITLLPETGKNCFSETSAVLTFTSIKEVQKYIDNVLSCLPSDTEYRAKKNGDYVFYSFTLHISAISNTLDNI